MINWYQVKFDHSYPEFMCCINKIIPQKKKTVSCHCSFMFKERYFFNFLARVNFFTNFTIVTAGKKEVAFPVAEKKEKTKTRNVNWIRSTFGKWESENSMVSDLSLEFLCDAPTRMCNLRNKMMCYIFISLELSIFSPVAAAVSQQANHREYECGGRIRLCVCVLHLCVCALI